MDIGKLQEKVEFFRYVTTKHNLIMTGTTHTDKVAFFSPSKTRKYWNLFLEKKRNPTLEMYIHIPYCMNSKCNFCMYNSKTVEHTGELEDYIGYLSEAISFFRSTFEGRGFDSLYIGGGTVSLLSPALMSQLFGDIYSNYEFVENSSHTLEISPYSVTMQQLDIAIEHGFNRISIGLQSLNPKALKMANRKVITIGQVEELIAFLRKRKVQETNIDLIGGLPGDTPDDFKNSFREVAKLGASTINIYFLRLENTRYSKKIQKEYSNYTGEGYTAELLDLIAPVAKKYHYCNSTSDPYYVCQRFYREDEKFPLIHHDTSWNPDRRNSCFGLGVGAKSHILDRVNFLEMGPYGFASTHISKALFKKMQFSTAKYRVSVLNEMDRMREYVINELYKDNKVEFRLFKKAFHKDVLDVFHEEIASLEKLGKLRLEPDHFSLDTDGIVERAVYMKFFNNQELLAILAEKDPLDYNVTS